MVPLFTNVMAPPLPTPRYYEIGSLVREVIEELPQRCASSRSSGHLSGRSRRRRCAFWDKAVRTRVRRRDEAGREQRLRGRAARCDDRAHDTSFMTFIMALGMARGAKPTSAEAVFTQLDAVLR